MVEKFEQGKWYRQLRNTNLWDEHPVKHGTEYYYAMDVSNYTDYSWVRFIGQDKISIDSDLSWRYNPKDFVESPYQRCFFQVLNNESINTFSYEDVFPMNIETIKAKNITEAKKQVEAERSNAEVEFAKRVLKAAIDEKDRLDAQIGELEKKREEQQKIIDKFK